MRLITKIFHKPGLVMAGKVVTREAVRGIVYCQDQLLMIFSIKNGDYKFPGGGVKPGEDLHTALVREVLEESGATVNQIFAEFGKVIEYDKPVEADYDLFKMTSNYFLCKIGDGFESQRLDRYEADLGFMPRWVSLDEAEKTNRALLHDKRRSLPRWVKRETLVLQELRQTLK